MANVGLDFELGTNCFTFETQSQTAIMYNLFIIYCSFNREILNTAFIPITKHDYIQLVRLTFDVNVMC